MTDGYSFRTPQKCILLPNDCNTRVDSAQSPHQNPTNLSPAPRNHLHRIRPTRPSPHRHRSNRKQPSSPAFRAECRSLDAHAHGGTTRHLRPANLKFDKSERGAYFYYGRGRTPRHCLHPWAARTNQSCSRQLGIRPLPPEIPRSRLSARLLLIDLSGYSRRLDSTDPPQPSQERSYLRTHCSPPSTGPARQKSRFTGAFLQRAARVPTAERSVQSRTIGQAWRGPGPDSRAGSSASARNTPCAIG
jgi:hypothetical protein